MKIAAIALRDFKRFKDLEIQVRNSLTQDVADQFLILGDNGTGKTTVLQAAALCLSMASWRTRSIDTFEWLGWVPGRYERWGRPTVELEIHFSNEEIEATREAARRWFSPDHANGDEEFIEPGSSKVVRLRLHGQYYSTDTKAELYQFRGRAYAVQLLKTDPSARELFDHLPGVFWFDQFRNLASPLPDHAHEEEDEPGGRVSFDVGVSRLREHLNRWQLTRLQRGPPTPDFLMQLENLYKRVFAGRSFTSPEPMYRGGMPTPADYYFTFSDGNRTYDIEEMSAGEQSVFPLLYEFVRQQIRNSVVLIDEIDLNLHPPLAQRVLAALPAIGPGCQFILTTHSPAISDFVSPEQIYRLEGGQLCL